MVSTEPKPTSTTNKLSPHPEDPLGFNRAEISLEPNLPLYRERAARRVKLGGLSSEVPSGWPSAVKSPLSWKKGDFDVKSSIYHLTKGDIEEIELALDHVKGVGLPLERVAQQNFPLPSLSSRLRALSESLYNDTGFFILRGLEPQRYTPKDRVTIFAGVSSHIGSRFGSQGEIGGQRRMLSHILDNPLSKESKDERAAIYSSRAKSFHTDVACDIIALFAIASAQRGGNTNLASMFHVYNEIAATRPDLIHTLSASDWPFQDFGPRKPFHRRALLYHEDGKVLFHFERTLLLGRAGQATVGLSEAQAEALDAVHFVAQKYAVEVPQNPGDIYFVNNRALLHSRGNFQDGATKRHLLRLWIKKDFRTWTLPAELQPSWDKAFVNSSGQDEIWDIDPVFLPTPVADQFTSSNH